MKLDLIGAKIKDLETGKIESIINTTSNSVEITQTKLTEHGINCSQWFEYGDKRFNKHFELIK